MTHCLTLPAAPARKFFWIKPGIFALPLEQQVIRKYMSLWDPQLLGERLDDLPKAAAYEKHLDATGGQHLEQVLNALREDVRVLHQKPLHIRPTRTHGIQPSLQRVLKEHVAAHGLGRELPHHVPTAQKLGQFVDRLVLAKCRVHIKADAIEIG